MLRVRPTQTGWRSAAPHPNGIATFNGPGHRLYSCPAMSALTYYAQRALGAFGLSVRRTNALPKDLDEHTLVTIRSVRPYTMTSPERVSALCQAVRYIVVNAIPGDIVECGVWRGGSMMAVALTLLDLGDTSRHLHLFDTFEGMVRPGPHDRFRDGSPATAVFDREIRGSRDSTWCEASLADVQAALKSTGYPEDHIHYVRGRVEKTLPSASPERLAILRLDTDWYESTRHELVCLFPRLVPGGVLIVDDYGFWQGSKRAVDEYFGELDRRPLLTRIDDSGRLAIVPGWLATSADETSTSLVSDGRRP